MSREHTLERVLRNLVQAARTSGGTAGADAGLMAACEAAETELGRPATRSSSAPGADLMPPARWAAEEVVRFMADHPAGAAYSVDSEVRDGMITLRLDRRPDKDVEVPAEPDESAYGIGQNPGRSGLPGAITVGPGAPRSYASSSSLSFESGPAPGVYGEEQLRPKDEPAVGRDK